jgi:hypothetical protein
MSTITLNPRNGSADASPATIVPVHGAFAADGAGAREVVEIEGASHAVGVSHPEVVADMILRAVK